MPRLPDGAPVIVGAGLAGLMTALCLAPRPAIVLARFALGAGSASMLAQGGVAAAVGADDTPALHAADTIAAGGGLVDPAVAARIAAAAPATIEVLADLGVRFDRDAAARFALGLEAAHSRHRIVHAGGDGSGREIMRAMIAAVRRTPSITVLEGIEARGLLTADGRIAGVLAVGPRGPLVLPTSRVVIATGGIGALYRHTTNPRGAWGQGLALAARAGAALADMEFVQFHPTALDSAADPMPLVSEAVRGDGAVLIDETGARFMAGRHRAELEPRDVVARAVWHHLALGHRIFLDARTALGERFAARFPGIAASCHAAGIDPATQPIPVRPAAHYHMGGIAVDGEGRSTVEGLWACGEAAATGLHGANRLASNSLLEAAAAAAWVAASVAVAAPAGPRLPPAPLPPPADPAPVRGILSAAAGVMREGPALAAAIERLRPLARGNGPAADPALVALFVAIAALRRRESRGSHCRLDFPKAAPHAERSLLRLTDVIEPAGARPAPSLVAAVGD